MISGRCTYNEIAPPSYIILVCSAENRLTAMSGGVTASYVYDGDGNRAKETIGPVFGHELHELTRKAPKIRVIRGKESRAHGGRRDLHPGLRCGEPLAAGEAGKHGAG